MVQSLLRASKGCLVIAFLSCLAGWEVRGFSLATNLKMVNESQLGPCDSDSSTVVSQECKDEGSAVAPQFKFGVITDIQYAPIPDGYSFAGVARFYRHSLQAARYAANHFEQGGAEIVLNLGDSIDGKCQAIEANGGDPLPEDADPGLVAIDDVLDALSPYKLGPILHSYGNHELYNLDRITIGEKLSIPFEKEICGDLVGYWTYSHRGVRFIMVDSYDVATMGRCKSTSKKYKQASSILAQENPNYPHNENSAEGLVNEEKRFVAFNGGLGDTQLDWLKTTLTSARECEEKVIVVSHQPIHPGSSNPICLVWNYQEVLDLLREFNDIVVASFCGHAHSGGYTRDESGIHFRSFEAVLESPHPHKTYGVVEVHDDRLVVHGHGNCASGVYSFDHQSTKARSSV